MNCTHPRDVPSAETMRAGYWIKVIHYKYKHSYQDSLVRTCSAGIELCEFP